MKTKHRVKTKSNLAIACLSSTDGIIGVIGQPLFISWVTAELQGNTSSTYCIRTLLSRIALRVLGIASLSHLAMMNVERYIAIKHPLQYETIVTENRLTFLSVLLWITVILLTVPYLSLIITFILLLTIVPCFYAWPLSSTVKSCFTTKHVGIKKKSLPSKYRWKPERNS